MELGAIGESPGGQGGHVIQQTVMQPGARWESIHKPENVSDCFCKINTHRVSWSQSEQGHAGAGEGCEWGNGKLTATESGWISEKIRYSSEDAGQVKWDARERSMGLLSQPASSL